MNKLIYIADDDDNIRNLLKTFLEREGFHVTGFPTGDKLFEVFSNSPADLIILDVMMPGHDGFFILKEIRKTSNVPIIMLTAKDDVSDKVMGLDMGADDYMTKPFAIEELLARIRVALKKNRARDTASNWKEEQCLRAGCITVDTGSWQVHVQGEAVALTRKEFDTLRYLMEHKGKAVTREQLLNEVWGYDFFGDSNIVDVYIRYLRHKIDDQFRIKTIHTIRSVGYLFSYEE